jgi:hypothetical protein
MVCYEMLFVFNSVHIVYLYAVSISIVINNLEDKNIQKRMSKVFNPNEKLRDKNKDIKLNVMWLWSS